MINESIVEEVFNKPDISPDQSIEGVKWLYKKFVEMQPEVYMEIGVGRLGHWLIMHSVLPQHGLAIGLDIQGYATWGSVHQSAGALKILLVGDSCTKEIYDAIVAILNGRKIDMLFIDGNHNYEYVRNDWDKFSPLVRSKGMVVFHDWDTAAVARGDTAGQGAAMVCNELQATGHQIQTVPKSSIGTAYLYMPQRRL